MLEFCQTVNPNLQDYEADGVGFFIFISWLGNLRSTNISYSRLGRLCWMTSFHQRRAAVANDAFADI